MKRIDEPEGWNVDLVNGNEGIWSVIKDGLV